MEVMGYVEARTGSRIRDMQVQHHDKSRDSDPMDVDSLAKRRYM